MMPLDEEHTRSVLESARAMLFSAGLDARCDHVNLAWRAFTGRTLEDALGDGWREPIHPDDREGYVALYLDHFARRETYETELRLRRSDGAYRYVLLNGAPRVDSAGALCGFVVSGFDVHERRDPYARDADEFFEISVDHLCVAGFDGYWKRLNAAWTQTLGWTPEEMMSRPLIEFVHPEDRAATLAARGRLIDGLPIKTQYNRYRCKDGTYRWLGWRSASVVARRLVYAVARDVTAEREAQRELRELTEHLAATLNSLADGVIATDPDGVVVRMNPVAEQLTGWSAAQAVGQPLGEVFEIVRSDSNARARAPIEHTLQESLSAANVEPSRLLTRDGTELPIAFSRAPMRDADGDVSGTVIVFRDLTSERQAKEVRRTLERQLVIADRMASVGTLAAGVAHEINNPLAYVTVNLDMIAEELRSAEPGSPRSIADSLQMVVQAREGTDRIRKIVRGLNTFSRTEDEPRGVIPLEPVLALSIDMALNEIRHRARLVTDYAPVPCVDGEASRLGQVFINLLVNAAQAIPEGSSDDNEIRIITSTDAAGCAVVEIRDTGPGIPPDVIDRIFDPFFTTKAIGVGTGLGLSICHNIVTSMGGRITATNREARGAIFRVTLPAASGAAAPREAPRVDAAGIAKPRRAAVLAVDDEPAIGVSIRRVLRDHDVTAVTSAREALDLVVSGVHFDVILSDLMMPGMSGMELHGELHRRNPRAAARMVFITGGAFTASARAFLRRVPNQRLEKPFDVSALRALVARSAE